MQLLWPFTVVRQASADVRVRVGGRVVDVQIPQPGIRRITPIAAHIRDVLALIRALPFTFIWFSSLFLPSHALSSRLFGGQIN